MAAAKTAPDFLNLWMASSPLFHCDSVPLDRCLSDHEPQPKVSNSSTATATTMASGVLGGLVNTGNTCFLNSVLQAMASSQHLINFLNSAVSASLPLATELRTLILDLNSSLPSQHTHSAVQLLRLLKSKRWIDDQEQQDAHEFFLSLLDALRVERVNGGDAVLPFDGLLSSRVVCLQCGEAQTVKQIPFSSLELSLPSLSSSSSSSSSPSLFSDQSVTVEAMLANAVAPEKLDVYCQRCSLVAAEAHLQRLIARASPPSSRSSSPEPENASRPKPDIGPILRARRNMINAALDKPAIQEADFEKLKPPRLVLSTKIKQATIFRPPRTLVLHVNRSEYDAHLGIAHKINTRVEFPERVQFGKYVTDSSEGSDGEAWYRLSSTVVHFGSHSFGHYVAYRRVGMDSWVRVSDGDVQPVGIDEVLSNGNVVLLFYELEPTVDLAAYDKEVIEEETKWPLYDVHESDDMSDLYSISSVESSTVLDATPNGRIRIPIMTEESKSCAQDARTNVCYDADKSAF
ncbi:hypothetical protein V1525DRAFT_382710 [Lipomyces kononenkoae]|uniref:Uncharacterized protein n=1 Tax=Lipomyces kononenkoae TaxID=34357 RepID=A0ACC3ST46_LIPKO